MRSSTDLANKTCKSFFVKREGVFPKSLPILHIHNRTVTHLGKVLCYNACHHSWLFCGGQEHHDPARPASPAGGHGDGSGSAMAVMWYIPRAIKAFSRAANYPPAASLSMALSGRRTINGKRRGVRVYGDT